MGGIIAQFTWRCCGGSNSTVYLEVLWGSNSTVYLEVLGDK